MCRNYGQDGKWLKGVIVKKLSSVAYLVQMSNRVRWKGHVNQLMDRCRDKPSTNLELVELFGNNDTGKVENTLISSQTGLRNSNDGINESADVPVEDQSVIMDYFIYYVLIL